MKMLDNLMKKLPEYVDRRCKKIAESIKDKTITNLTDATKYLSDVQDFPFVYSTNKKTKDEIIYEISVVGKQVAFLEFGTGAYNEKYSEGLTISEYVPEIAHKVPLRASYGLHKGKYKRWGFYPSYDGNVSSANGDFKISYTKYTRKSDGGVSFYPLKNPVIITQGLAPQRMIYRAIKETKREVGSKK